MRKSSGLMPLLLGLGATHALASAALATPPQEATGDMNVVEGSVVDTPVREAGGNLFFIHTGDLDVTGDLSGTCEFDEVITVHPKGNVTVRGEVTCELEVLERTGDVVFRINGTGHVANGTFQGRLTAISATGELANLRGQGTMEGDGLEFSYAMRVHFDPQ